MSIIEPWLFFSGFILGLNQENKLFPLFTYNINVLDGAFLSTIGSYKLYVFIFKNLIQFFYF